MSATKENPDNAESTETVELNLGAGETPSVLPGVEEPILIDEPLEDDESLDETIKKQDVEAVAFAEAFLKKIITLRGVRVEREAYLGRELRKLGLSDAQIAEAIATTPVQAGVSLAQLDELADATLGFETNKSALLSFTAGIPGGFAMLASVPGDITQYYVHAFRIMQKLAYLYGWQNFLTDLDDVDDETLGKLALFLGVMMGVGGASTSLTMFATQVARPAVQKHVTQKALTKTAWFGPAKKTLRIIGVKLTKDSLGKTVSKAIPLAGGVISGSMTMVSLRTQSGRLKKHLRELAPPGMDSATYAALVSATEPEIGAPGRFAKLARAKDKLPFGKRSKDPQEIAVDLESAQEELK